MVTSTERQIWALRQCVYVSYISLATCTAWLYEFLTAISEEVRMFTEISISMADIAYLVSRVMTMACVITILPFTALSNPTHCAALMKFCSITGALAVPFSSLLFFLRIKGIYHDSRVILITFSLLWLSTWTSLLIPISYSSITGQNGHTSWCWIPKVSRSSCIPFISLILFDTAVITAITTRVVLQSQAKSFTERISFVIFAKDAGHVAKSLLRSGQLYYMITLGINIAILAAILSNAGSTLARATLAMFSLVFQNITACRVFRLLRFGHIQDDPSSATIFPHNIVPRSAHLTLIRTASYESLDALYDTPVAGDDQSANHLAISRIASDTVKIAVHKETEVTVDPEPPKHSSSDLGHV